MDADGALSGQEWRGCLFMCVPLRNIREEDAPLAQRTCFVLPTLEVRVGERVSVFNISHFLSCDQLVCVCVCDEYTGWRCKHGSGPVLGHCRVAAGFPTRPDI